VTLNGGERTVAEVMTTPHWLLVRNDTDRAADVFQMMEQQSLASVPVVNSADRSWRGLVLLRDLAPLGERASGFGRTTAAKVARSELSLAPTDSLAAALELMREHEVGRLPVVDGRTLVGSITREVARSHLDGTATTDPRGWHPPGFTAYLRGVEPGPPALGRWEDVLQAERSRAYRVGRAAARFDRLRRFLRLPRAIAHPRPADLEEREKRVRGLRRSWLRRFVPRPAEPSAQTQPGERPAPGPRLDQEIDASLEMLAHVPFEELQERGWHVQPKHFYWPLNDLKFLRENPRLWLGPRPLGGIDVDLPGQRELAQRMAAHMHELQDVKDERPRRPPGQFFWNNNSFPPMDAQVYYGLVRELKPARVIEVGAGYSSLILARALAANDKEADVTLIEPHPNPETIGNLTKDWKLIPKIVQLAPLETFGSLGAGDVLFYDGSHCLNTGSDVEWIFFHVLPRLRPGVWIHFHDIQWPHGYPEAQVLDDGLSWNEQYVLEAFLAHNNAYRLRFSTSLMVASRRSLMTSLFRGKPVGASVWIEKTG